MNCRVLIQQAEALGDVNRWHCSRWHRREVTCPDLLWAYFIKSGGARDFAKRYAEAMGDENRWYCSEYYGFDVRDPEMLWAYYMNGVVLAKRGIRELVR